MNFIRVGAFLTALSVIMGAFGAHGIRGKIADDLFQTYQTASHYFMIHSIAIVIYGIFCISSKSEMKTWPGYLFLLGIALFSGSLYLLVFTEIRALGMITPFGGLSFIIAWIGFGLHAKRA
jgi:uncharacterized membrane protein YgdD (TMEM256/DUF423 family)